MTIRGIKNLLTRAVPFHEPKGLKVENRTIGAVKS